MDFKPPIPTRTTKELMNIITNYPDWNPEAVIQAKNELESRGVSFSLQKTRANSHQKHLKTQLFLKGKASYTLLEFILLVIFGPLLVVIFQSLHFYNNGLGFKKKNAQGIVALFLGIFFWYIVIRNI